MTATILRDHEHGASLIVRPLYTRQKFSARSTFDRRYEPPHDSGLITDGDCWALSRFAKIKVGDVLVGKEAFTIYEKQVPSPDGRHFRRVPACLYAADFDGFEKPDRDWDWRSPVTMPQWASRWRRVVTDVAVKRLQEITEEEALEAGAPYEWHGIPVGMLENYRPLWNATNPKHPWESNPFVVLVSVEEQAR